MFTIKRHQENKGNGVTARDEPGRTLSSPKRRLTRCAVMANIAMLAGGFAASAEPEVFRCLPPEAPLTDLPDAVLAEYRTEIAAEYEEYFAAISDYVACLDDERSRTLAEARDATEAYSTLLKTIPAKKDRE